MMNIANLERAHLTLGFLSQIAGAKSVNIKFLQRTETINAIVKVTDGNVRYFTFEIGSDDDCYHFIEEANPINSIRIALLPDVLCL